MEFILVKKSTSTDVDQYYNAGNIYRIEPISDNECSIHFLNNAHCNVRISANDLIQRLSIENNNLIELDGLID